MKAKPEKAKFATEDFKPRFLPLLLVAAVALAVSLNGYAQTPEAIDANSAGSPMEGVGSDVMGAGLAWDTSLQSAGFVSVPMIGDLHHLHIAIEFQEAHNRRSIKDYKSIITRPQLWKMIGKLGKSNTHRAMAAILLQGTELDFKDLRKMLASANVDPGKLAKAVGQIEDDFDRNEGQIERMISARTLQLERAVQNGNLSESQLGELRAVAAELEPFAALAGCAPGIRKVQAIANAKTLDEARAIAKNWSGKLSVETGKTSVDARSQKRGFAGFLERFKRKGRSAAVDNRVELVPDVELALQENEENAVSQEGGASEMTPLTMLVIKNIYQKVLDGRIAQSDEDIQELVAIMGKFVGKEFSVEGKVSGNRDGKKVAWRLEGKDGTVTLIKEYQDESEAQRILEDYDNERVRIRFRVNNPILDKDNPTFKAAPSALQMLFMAPIADERNSDAAQGESSSAKKSAQRGFIAAALGIGLALLNIGKASASPAHFTVAQTLGNLLQLSPFALPVIVALAWIVSLGLFSFMVGMVIRRIAPQSGLLRAALQGVVSAVAIGATLIVVMHMPLGLVSAIIYSAGFAAIIGILLTVVKP